MKKIFSVLLLFGALSAAAEDSYLYWMLGDTGDYSYSKVRVIADGNSSSPLTIYAPDSTSSTGLSSDSYTELSSGQANIGALYAKLVGGTTYSSFVVELLNESGDFVAQSATLAYSSQYIATFNSLNLADVWVASSFAIPEPNSAMLLLLGCAALGLRRRRQLKD